MAAKNKGLSNPYVKVNRRKRIGFNFSDKHKRYIKNCVNSTYNILEGAVRSGKTVDNVFAFAHELKTTKDSGMSGCCFLPCDMAYKLSPSLACGDINAR